MTKSTKDAEAGKATEAGAKPAQPKPASKKSKHQLLEGVLKGEVPFSEFLTQHPEIVMQMAERGYTLYQEGMYDKAEQIFLGLQVILPEEAYFKMALGVIWLAQNRLDEAEKAFEGAIQFNPIWGAPLVSRGELLLRRGKLIDAAKDFQKAMQLDPEAKEPETKHARLLAAATLANLRLAIEAKKLGKPIDDPEVIARVTAQAQVQMGAAGAPGAAAAAGAAPATETKPAAPAATATAAAPAKAGGDAKDKPRPAAAAATPKKR